jgi:hypothetical protein
MNKRINELAEQAGFPAQRAFSDLSDLYPRLEKYTELVVRECICQCADRLSQQYIMEHFGMSEKDWKSK